MSCLSSRAGCYQSPAKTRRGATAVFIDDNKRIAIKKTRSADDRMKTRPASPPAAHNVCATSPVQLRCVRFFRRKYRRRRAQIAPGAVWHCPSVLSARETLDVVYIDRYYTCTCIATTMPSDCHPTHLSVRAGHCSARPGEMNNHTPSSSASLPACKPRQPALVGRQPFQTSGQPICL